MKNQKGYTLIEILVSIAIASALSAIAIMYIPGIRDGYKVRGTARQLYSDMQMARLRAIKEGKQFAMEFTGSTAYCVKSEVNTVGNAADGFTDGCTTTSDTIIKTVDLAGDYSGVNITVKPTRDIFYPDGRADYNGAASGTVTITKGSRTQSLCITTGTGNIRIVNSSTCS